jgi:transposase
MGRFLGRRRTSEFLGRHEILFSAFYCNHPGHHLPGNCQCGAVAMTSTEIRDRRRTLRYRGLLVKQMVQMKNRISGLLMETGASFNKQRLHKVGYFTELMSSNEEIDCVRPLLKLSRDTINRSQKLDYALVSSLERDPLLAERLKRLRTVPGVGPITALTWVLEIGDVVRFRSIKQAISYCGLCGAERSSADKVMRTPISKSATSISSRYWWKQRSWHRDTAMN